MSMNTIKYLFVCITLFFVAIVGDIILDNWHYKAGDHRRLQKEVNKKFRLVDRTFQRLEENKWQLKTQVPADNGIIMLAYRNDSLIYWSDNSITLSPFNKNSIAGKRFVFISNGWYVVKSFINDSLRAYGLILIKTQYPYENDFLKNRFQPDLNLPQSTELLTEAKPGSFSIHDWEGIYLFSIKFDNKELRFAYIEKYFLPVLFLLAFVTLLFLINNIFQRISKPVLRNSVLYALVVFFILMRWLQYRFHIPVDIYDLELFGPVPFARSIWLPSLGDVFLNTSLLLFLIIMFQQYYKFPERLYSEKISGNYINIIVLFFLLTCFFAYSHFILSNLILHSTITFEPYKVASLTGYSLIGWLIAAMHFTAILLITNRLLTFCKNKFEIHELILIFVIVSFVIFLILYMLDYKIDPGSGIAFLIMFTLLAIIRYRNIPGGAYTALAFMVMFFSAYSVYFVTQYSKQKSRNNMRVMAENLATQHDPVAEYLLEDISRRMSEDRTLARYLFNYNISNEQIFNHLRGNYFNGFWGNYKIRFVDCRPNTVIIPDDSLIHKRIFCFDFYREKLESGSQKLPRSDFYFLDIQNGSINYLGWINYKNPGQGSDLTFFIELESRLTAEELGYPELLLDEKYQKNKSFEEYSYAKYFENKLITRSGSFQYSHNLDTYKNKPESFEGYNHLIYYINKNNVVMVSKPTTSFFNNLVSFSYLFLFYFLILMIYILVRDFSKLGRDIEFNFKNKIQLSIISILLLSLILVGGGTIYFSIEQYQKKQHDILSEKIQSVYNEIDHLLAYQPRLKSDMKGIDFNNLDQLMIRLSDVFYSDINLYDPDGNLLATSRSEIFDQGMLGEKMNPEAYHAMVNGKQAEFIHPENIGNLRFLSAYVPFVNAENKLLAFLNLPYFTKQNILRNDVTTLVVAIVNIYVLLILITIGVTIIISGQITRPLKLIQQKFSETKLGKKSEPIIYHGKDEIAGLVDEYNRMVKELAKSVNMLARSERESAWREMAKQVAHEINNPLTPMKLSVQHLMRSWQDNRENFDEFLEKVTHTLIEQIDNLSFIASEFSNFAKMPKAYNEVINIVEVVKSTLNLFSNTDNVEFILEHDNDEVFVFADKEQLSRVFINLLKNAIQSIPDSRKGRVGIFLVTIGDAVRISMTDNGKGIPLDLQDKLFTPSFTTKSSGMGLGLSIVKNIIESFDGNITFKTKFNHGTTFVIELPVHGNESVDVKI
jgi:two-component system nitrogen regulation sensor histidine kinase NtrY